MGKRGPQPTPTATLKMRGSWRAKTRPEEPIPDPVEDIPDAPRFLGARGQEIWKEEIIQLRSSGVIGKSDLNALARYCRLCERWETSELFLLEHGERWVKKNEDGSIAEIIEFPEVARSRQLNEALLRLESHFGKTPSSRTSVRSDNKPAGGGVKCRLHA